MNAVPASTASLHLLQGGAPVPARVPAGVCGHAILHRAALEGGALPAVRAAGQVDRTCPLRPCAITSLASYAGEFSITLLLPRKLLVNSALLSFKWEGVCVIFLAIQMVCTSQLLAGLSAQHESTLQLHPLPCCEFHIIDAMWQWGDNQLPRNED